MNLRGLPTRRSIEIALGLLALAFAAIHSANHLRHGDHWSELLWVCNVANLLVGAGLLARLPRLASIGCLWLSVGVPLWIVQLALGDTALWTSYLIHLGGLAVALAATRLVGMARGAAWQALLALASLQAICRLATPPSANVNMVFSMVTGWDRVFPSYFWNYLGSLFLHAAVFVAVERTMRRAAPA